MSQMSQTKDMATATTDRGKLGGPSVPRQPTWASLHPALGPPAEPPAGHSKPSIMSLCHDNRPSAFERFNENGVPP